MGQLTPRIQALASCLGSNLADNEKPQYTVPPYVWFGSFPTKDLDISPDGSVQPTPPRDRESHYSLVGCTCAPAFQFQDFELGKRSDLISQFPHLESLIIALTYPDSRVAEFEKVLSFGKTLACDNDCHISNLFLFLSVPFYSDVDYFCSI